MAAVFYFLLHFLFQGMQLITLNVLISGMIQITF